VTVLLTLFTLPSSPSAAPNLQLVQLISAGSDRVVQTSIFKETNIPFATASGVHGPQISEWFILTLLTFNHAYDALYESYKKQAWDSSKGSNVQDVVGQRLGVLGYGSIGRQAARVAKAMGFDVIAYTASPRDTPEKRRDPGFIVPGTGDADGSIPSAWYSGTDKESLHNFLSQDIDVLLVGVPLTAATRHLLSTEEFEILSKKKAFISNIARGPIIDSTAIRVALEEGKLRGAALDVTDPEPLPADDPLWKAPNVFITPHVSGNTKNYADRAFQLLEANLERKANGEKLINVIDRKRGY
jgi:phosphoglycerate dehydrogenase-like enzyme